ncbi:hypothetical protein ISS30_04570 [bacterium]|nr:hypothetical protein [bacterium]
MKIVSRATARVAPTYRIFEWCHATPHDTNVLFILCMVSTAESRHHIELNPIFKVNPHAPSAHPEA